MNADSARTASEWMTRATDALALGRQALDAAYYDQVPNRAYYAATALLETRGLRASRHSAVLQLIGREFVVGGSLAPEHGKRLNILFEERQRADYMSVPAVNREDATGALTDAEAFVAAASALLDRILAEDPAPPEEEGAKRRGE